MSVYPMAMVDAHVHLRQGNMTKIVGPYSARCCQHIIAMPNLSPPICGPDDIRRTLSEYREAVGGNTNIWMTAKLMPDTTPKDVELAKKAGAIGYKLYPAHATTNSHDGIPVEWLRNPPIALKNVLAAIDYNDMVLLNHGEMPDVFCMDREVEYLTFLDWVVDKYPQLRVTLEHISSGSGVDWVLDKWREGASVLGTITLHHLLLTLDDVVGGKLRPDHFCMPIAKTYADRSRLLDAIGLMCFAFGSDSAPHLAADKYCASGCAGVFSSPVMMEKLVEMFMRDAEPGSESDVVFKMDQFCAVNAARFYRLKLQKDRTIKVDNKPIVVNKLPDPTMPTPFLCGNTINWSIDDGVHKYLA